MLLLNTHLPRLSRPRAGNVSLYFLVFMGLTVPTMFWTINIWRIAEGKISQQRLIDTCAHAALCELTEEFTTDSITFYSPLLYGDPSEIEDLCQNHASQEAKNYAGIPTPSELYSNYVDGKPLTLKINDDNDKDDVQYGSYDVSAASPTFTLIDPAAAAPAERREINAVRVTGFRTIERKNSVALFGPAWTGYTDAQIVTRVTAVLDRRVVGFRHHSNNAGGSLGFQKIPLAPVALLNDASATSWRNTVEAKVKASDTKLNYQTMTVNIPTANYIPGAALNSVLLDIGADDYGDISRQLKEGLSADDVTAYGNDLILDKTTYTLPVPQFAAPAGNTTAGTDFDKLYQAFLTLKNDRTERAWALTELLPPSGNVTVKGFVAARIVDIQVMQHAGSAPTNYIQLTLQPTLLHTPTAFTDYSNMFAKTTPSPYAGFSRLINPYLGRVRLVE